jgi:2'-hydroxyisoflavone reductase
MPGRVLNVRPGLIVGPDDPTDRFTYWPVRIARGGEVLAPGNPSDPVQVIDARDLAEWIVRLAEQRVRAAMISKGRINPSVEVCA